mmetsp:Transcript_39162/g.117747  ORF Transcript_39162/g.117747 Transcript_39162/m.117747 type:complete len:397 (-) Transcript_39162:33-1223(-)
MRANDVSGPAEVRHLLLEGHGRSVRLLAIEELDLSRDTVLLLVPSNDFEDVLLVPFLNDAAFRAVSPRHVDHGPVAVIVGHVRGGVPLHDPSTQVRHKQVVVSARPDLAVGHNHANRQRAPLDPQDVVEIVPDDPIQEGRVNKLDERAKDVLVREEELGVGRERRAHVGHPGEVLVEDVAEVPGEEPEPGGSVPIHNNGLPPFSHLFEIPVWDPPAVAPFGGHPSIRPLGPPCDVHPFGGPCRSHGPGPLVKPLVHLPGGEAGTFGECPEGGQFEVEAPAVRLRFNPLLVRADLSGAGIVHLGVRGSVAAHPVDGVGDDRPWRPSGVGRQRRRRRGATSIDLFQAASSGIGVLRQDNDGSRESRRDDGGLQRPPSLPAVAEARRRGRRRRNHGRTV